MPRSFSVRPLGIFDAFPWLHIRVLRMKLQPYALGRNAAQGDYAVTYAYALKRSTS
jgi:hypothetical protein